MTALGKIRRVRLALSVAGLASATAGCGGEDFDNEPRPPVGIELTGVIQNRGVTVSPNGFRNRVGAGPVLITISNQTDDSHTVTLEGESVEETVGPVQPRDTATIQKSLDPGDYEVRAGSPRAAAREIPAAQLTIGRKRRSSNKQVLLP